MGAMASQITSRTIVHLTVYSGADQRKYQSSTSLAFVWGIHRSPVNSHHKGPVTRKMFPFDVVIMADDTMPTCVASSWATEWIIQTYYSYLIANVSFLGCHSQPNHCYCFETLQWYVIFIESNPMTAKLATRVYQSEWCIVENDHRLLPGIVVARCQNFKHIFLKSWKLFSIFIKNAFMFATNDLFRINRNQFLYCLTLDLQQTITW